jgi:Protein of unknown function (DUF2971)
MRDSRPPEIAPDVGRLEVVESMDDQPPASHEQLNLCCHTLQWVWYKWWRLAMRTYKYLPIQYGIDNLLKRRIKISRWEEMNDPFELRGASTDSAYSQLVTYELCRTGGVLCFSKSESDPLLWSHYAESHRGCCIAFEIDGNANPVEMDLAASPKRVLVDLDAVATRLSQAPGNLRDHIEEVLKEFPELDRATEAVLLTKYKGWSYEQEIRVMVGLQPEQKDGDLYFADVDANIRPVEVLLGIRCTDADKARFHEAVDRYDPPLPITRMTIATDSFEIIRKPE